MLQVNFKSTLAPTDYLKKGFDTAINNSLRKTDFLDAVEAILNDGSDDVVEISSKGTPKGRLSVGEQCVRDVVDFAAKNKNVKADPVSKAISDIEESIFGLLLTAKTSSVNDITKITKQLKVISDDYNSKAAEKLKEIEAQIFS